MRIAIGSDHGGTDLKAAILAHLIANGHDVQDLGTDGATSVDYPDFAKAVCGRVVDDTADRGILVCGTGQGMAMTANKVSGIRAAVVNDTFSARMAMLHNNAKVLCLGQRITGSGLALELVDAWMSCEFEGGRHQRRVAKMTS
ncbi:MAG: ribose 5-phosphate isomerase B [Rhodobacterales bacterium]|nr:ribose 5-phosphate isomerase B [Rhodobacterales bacterium]